MPPVVPTPGVEEDEPVLGEVAEPEPMEPEPIEPEELVPMEPDDVLLGEVAEVPDEPVLERMPVLEVPHAASTNTAARGMVHLIIRILLKSSSGSIGNA